MPKSLDRSPEKRGRAFKRDTRIPEPTAWVEVVNDMSTEERMRRSKTLHEVLAEEINISPEARARLDAQTPPAFRPKPLTDPSDN